MLKIGIAVSLAIALVAISVWQYSKSRTHQISGELISRVETQEKLVALTFDDGPKPLFTEKILQVLAGLNVKATFFLIGESIKSNPELAKVINDQGHQLGNHSYYHKRMIFVGRNFVKSEIERTNIQIRKAGFEGDILFRPPYGKKLLNLPVYLNENKIPTIMWDIEPETYSDTKSPEVIANYVVSHTKPDSIILLHVMHELRTTSMKSVPIIVKKLLEKGYKFVTVSELLAKSI